MVRVVDPFPQPVAKVLKFVLAKTKQNKTKQKGRVDVLIEHQLHDYIPMRCLRTYDCKYRESLARLKKSKILIICLENPFREIHSKKIFQSLKNQMFPRKWGKTKIRVFT